MDHGIQEEVDGDDADTSQETVLERHRRLVSADTTNTTKTKTTDGEAADAAEKTTEEPDAEEDFAEKVINATSTTAVNEETA